MDEPVLVGYRGQTSIDTGYYFCPFRPGMSDEEMSKVLIELKTHRTTDLQKKIMEMIAVPVINN